MKLKLTTKLQAAPEGAAPGSVAQEPPVPTPTTATGSGVKLKFKSLGSAASTAIETQPPEAPKPKRKYTKKPKVDENGNAIPPKSKKRTRDENGDDGSPAAKRKPKPTAKSLAMVHDSDDDETVAPPRPSAAPRQPPVRSASLLKLKMKGSKVPPNALQRSNTTMIKIKGVHGKPPVRPPGVGYDSEAEEAEEDPAIESQFILRMQPGPDCDALRKAIEERTVGKSVSAGGTSVQFRFFDKEGRRATVQIHGRLYAAAMVDLPCVSESMKSWNKKDWVKTADVCQMLLVLGRVQSEDEAKRFPLPREVNSSSHQYAHGITPPMHHVRKHRFRPRVSYHRIEQIEAEVNALIDADRRSSDGGGRSEYQILDVEEQSESEDASSDEDGEADAHGEPDHDDHGFVDPSEMIFEAETPGGEEMEVDGSDLQKLLEEGLMGEGEDLFGDNGAEVETPATSHEVAMHTLGENSMPTDTAASTPNAATSPDDDEEDDDDAESAEGEIDAEAAAAQAGREEQMGEIRELEQEIENTRQQMDRFNNVIYKQRMKQKITQLTEDLNLKKAALGIEEDG